DAPANFGAIQADVLGTERELGRDRGRHDLLGRVLEDRPDMPRDIAQLQLGARPAFDPNDPGKLAGVGMWDEPVHCPDERALATARRAGDEQDLARMDGNGDVAERRLRGAPVPEREVLELDDRLGHRRSPGQAGRIVTGRSTPMPRRRATSAWLSA